MAEKRFFSPELLAAYEFLDKFINENRRANGRAETHKRLITQLRDLRHGIEEADIALDENSGGVKE